MKDLKLFDKWNTNKKELEQLKLEDYYVNEREIYYVKMWINLWFEQDGKKDFLRPVLVLKKLWNVFLTIALTSKNKKNVKFYYKFKTAKFVEDKKKYENNSYCILSQIKVMDKKRFVNKIWYISKNEFENVRKILRDFLL